MARYLGIAGANLGGSGTAPGGNVFQSPFSNFNNPFGGVLGELQAGYNQGGGGGGGMSAGGGGPIGGSGPTTNQQIATQANALANQIIAEQQLAETVVSNGRIYTTFGPGDVQGDYEEIVTKGLFINFTKLGK